MLAPRRIPPPHGLKAKSEETVIAVETVNDPQTRRDSPPTPLRPSPSARNAGRSFPEGTLPVPARLRDLRAQSRSRPPWRLRCWEQTAHRHANRRSRGCRRHWRPPLEFPPPPPRLPHRASNPRAMEPPLPFLSRIRL